MLPTLTRSLRTRFRLILRSTRFQVYGTAMAVVAGLYQITIGGMTQCGPEWPSRIRADMRSLATMLEAYRIDHGAYPAMRPLRELCGIRREALKEARGYELFAVEPGSGSLAGLTTPVAYMNQLELEPRIPRNRNPIVRLTRGLAGLEDQSAIKRLWPYPYYNDRNLGWIVWAAGPDGVYDITDCAAVYDATVTSPSAALIGLTYDPTNGIYSSGDFWMRHKPDRPPGMNTP